MSARLVNKIPIFLLGIGLNLQFAAMLLLLLRTSISLFGLLSAMFLIFAAEGFLIADAQAAAFAQYKAYAVAALAVFEFYSN